MKKFRQSSLEAHESVKPKKEIHYGMIKKAIKYATISGRGGGVTGKQISGYCNLTYHQVMRRLSEMEKGGIIKVVGRAVNIQSRPLLWDLN